VSLSTSWRHAAMAAPSRQDALTLPYLPYFNAARGTTVCLMRQPMRSNDAWCLGCHSSVYMPLRIPAWTSTPSPRHRCYYHNCRSSLKYHYGAAHVTCLAYNARKTKNVCFRTSGTLLVAAQNGDIISWYVEWRDGAA